MLCLAICADFVADLAENHRIFQSKLTSLPDTRFQRHDFVAIVTCLEIATGPTDVKALSLKKMYEGEQEFNQQWYHCKQNQTVLTLYVKSS